MEKDAHPISDSGGLKFKVEIDGKMVAIRISDEALEDHFGANVGISSSQIKAYRENSERIDAMARQLYNKTGGPVLLRTSDF